MMRIVEKTWNEYWAYQSRIIQREAIPGIEGADRQLVDFIEQACELKTGQRILDIGCGGGHQALHMAKRGYKVLGLDIAPDLIKNARDMFRKEGVKGRFVVADMRKMAFKEEFDVSLMLGSTFGFFGDAEDESILRAMKVATRKKGKVFISFTAANELLKNSKSWRRINDGWHLYEGWFNPVTNSYHTESVIITDNGTVIKPKYETGYSANESIRCYTLPEMKKMLENVGLRCVASYSLRDLSIPPKEPNSGVIRNIVLAQNGSGL